MRQDPVLSQVKLIAEPGNRPDGYQLGNFPPGWAEWNDRYRDNVRSYWHGDAGRCAELRRGLLGSADLFDKRGRRPWASVNFVTAHDGFTLADLVRLRRASTTRPTARTTATATTTTAAGTAASRADRRSGRSWRSARAHARLLATLLSSQGAPMLLMGDEIGRTQGGNNNAYCQDNETVLDRLGAA